VGAAGYGPGVCHDPRAGTAEALAAELGWRAGTREQVTELGAVLAGMAPGRPGPEAVTLFDSTGLAIQDLAIAAAAFKAFRDGRVEAQRVTL
jgi:ornithine cyclodeaminase/alanine dehydrogenase-like protein (mu-crystallin family)